MSSSPSPSSSASATPPPPDSLSAPPTTNPTPASPPPAAPGTPPLTASPPPSSPPPASLPPPASPPPAADPPPPLSPPPASEAFPPPPATPSPPPPAAISTPTAADPPPTPIPASPPPPNAASPPPIADTIPQPSLPSPPRTPTPSPPSSASPPPPSLGGPPTSTSPPSPPILEPPKTSPPSSPSASPPSSHINSSSATTPSPDQIPSPSTPPASILPGNSTNSAGPIFGNTRGGGSTRTSTIIVPVSVVVALFLLSSLGLALWLIRRRRKPSADGYAAGFVMPSPFNSSAISESPHLRSPTAPHVVHHHKSASVGIGNAQLSFTYDELHDMTNGFSTQHLLGEGGFGCVYKGCLPYGREVAVKQLKVGSGQGEREFKAEVEIISRVHHRHLVSLVGYCISDSQRLLLVYDFVPNGTLDSHLHGKEETAVLDWPTRVKIAAGAARGIAYLHEDCYPRIIHRDIKSSNILLDNNFEAQVSDFGLARLAMDAKTHVTTRVVGTFGYLAPEYASSGKLTDRSDVYSFGVVLLELITGRKPVDNTQPMGEESLVEWARPRLMDALETRDFGEIPDPRLGNDYNENEMFHLIEAAAACIRHSATMRPSMGKVVRVLDALADVDLNNGVKPGQSKILNTLESSDIRLFQRIAFGSQVFSPEHSQFSRSNQSEL